MTDERIFRVIARWESLSPLERMHLCWVSFWTQYNIGLKAKISILVFIAMIGIFNIADKGHSRIMLLAGLALFYFYTLLLDHYYRRHYASHQ